MLPGRGCWILDAGYLSLDAEYRLLDTGFVNLILNRRNTEHETWNPEPGTRNVETLNIKL